MRECGESQTSRTRVFHIKRRGIPWYRSQLPIAAYSLLRAVTDVSTIFAFSVNIFSYSIERTKLVTFQYSNMRWILKKVNILADIITGRPAHYSLVTVS